MVSDIFQAVRLNEIGVFKELLGLIDVNVIDVDGGNLLHEAIAHDRTNLALDLIAHQIDVNHQNNDGQTPLHFSALYGNYNIAEAILKNGGNLNIQDKYLNNALWTATFHAKGKYDIVELFKRSGGNPRSENKAGRSALDFAHQIGDEILVAILEL